VIGGPKPRLAINTTVAVSESVLKQKEVTDTFVPVWDTSRKDGSPGPSMRQQPAMINSQKESIVPVGDACREDGTLKDASEITWLNSPSDEFSHLEPNEKWGQSPSGELEFPDSPSEPASERNLSKRAHHTSGSNSEDERPNQAKVSE
jgi:hypothetical protein